MHWIVPLATLVAGFVVLAWSADRLVESASALALRLGLAQVVVGVFIVGFGTSLPELMVSLLAALDRAPELALGNALGSNIANVALILGTTLVLLPLPRHSIRQPVTVTLLACATLGTMALLANLVLGRMEGGLLLAGLAASLLLIYRSSRGDPPDVPASPERAREAPWRIAGLLLISLALVLGSARALVWAAITLAEAAGVSELVIGLGVVAVGTSLPELATGLAAARRRELALLYGNLLGSNLFNLLAVLGVTALVHPVMVAPLVLARDGLLVSVLTVPLLLLALGRLRGSRALGAGLLAVYALYQAWLFLS